MVKEYHRSMLWLLGLGLVVCGEASALDIYRWRDANDVVHFTDEPRAGATRLHLSSSATAPRNGRVERVIDGDTLLLTTGQRIRLLGINAPEVPHRGAPGEPGGLEASSFLKEQASGSRITLAYGPEKRDRYDRFLAYVHLPDGTDLNERLVANGHAYVTPRPPNLARVERYFATESQARAERKGLWSRTRYAPQPVARAAEYRNSFRRLRGRVTAIRKEQGRPVLIFGNHLRAFVTESAHPFTAEELATLPGSRLVVRGWVRQRDGRPALLLRHPLQLER